MACVYIFVMLLAMLICQPGCSRTILQSAHQEATANVAQPNTIGYYLPKGLIRIKLKKPQSNNAYEFSCESEIVPDPRHFYTLKYNPNIFFSDTGTAEVTAVDKENSKMMSIALDKKGLLTSISAVSEDKTQEIIKDLMSALTLERGLKKKYPSANVVVPKNILLNEVIDISFDPDDGAEIKRLNRSFEPLGIVIQVQRLAGPPPVDYYAPSQQRGVYYRPCLPYLVTISQSALQPTNYYTVDSTGQVVLFFGDISEFAKLGLDLKQKIETNFERHKVDPTVRVSKPDHPETDLKKLAQDAGLSPENRGFLITKVFQLPNNAPVLALDLTRSPFVQKSYNLTFKDGILSSYTISKPSEVLAGLEIPLDVVRALVALPTNLIQLKIDTAVKAKDLAKAEYDLFISQKNFLEELSKNNPNDLASYPSGTAPGLKSYEGMYASTPSAPKRNQEAMSPELQPADRRVASAPREEKITRALVDYLQAIENMKNLRR